MGLRFFVWFFWGYFVLRAFVFKKKKKKDVGQDGTRYLDLCPQDEPMKRGTSYKIAFSRCSRINLETGTLPVKLKGRLIF